MSKIAAAVLNRKGGVGKTTIAVILAEIALVRRNKVLAIDLDPSKNFTDALMQIKNSFKDSLRIKDTLEDSDADATEEWIVIDCPPNLDDASLSALLPRRFQPVRSLPQYQFPVLGLVLAGLPVLA